MLTVATEPAVPRVEDAPTERLVLGWWNTSLSPVGSSRANDEQKLTAQRIVKILMDGIGVDCLALGEVTHADLTYLRDGCGIPSLSVYDGTLREGRLQFDTGAIYNISVLS